MTPTKIQKEDVIQVATSIKQILTEQEINEVIERYPSAEDQDPTGTWDLIVEQVIYEILDER
ncbi:MAG TPA: hypothetical protein VMX17_09630 [Candidatus Glassbacteria bacterium]|nr:hypothetical protein [Candidatus Glassbacteria bacterium]